MAPGAFSRIALAAALLEYDNDPEDPTKPTRSANESAIFSHLRRSGPVKRPESVLAYDDLPEPRRSTDYLNVALPIDQGSIMMSPTSPRDPSITGPRASYDRRRSLDVLREQGERYFDQPPDEEDEDEHSSSADDVDLTSWGLDSFIPPKSRSGERLEKKPGPGRRRPASEYNDHLPNPHSPQSNYPQSSFVEGQRPRHAPNARSFSLGADLGLNSAFTDGPEGNATFPRAGRRHTMLFPSDHPGATEGASAARPHSIAGLPSFPSGTIDPTLARLRPLPDDQDEDLKTPEEEANPFAVPLPEANRISRFDPKAAQHARTTSGNSWSSKLAVEAPTDAARLRSTSNGSMTSRALFDTANADDGASQRQSIYPESAMDPNRHLSRLELMRPKLLIMPSPLRDVEQSRSASEMRMSSAGFQDSTDDRPLPANFRASSSMSMLKVPRPSMAASKSLGAVPSFTPNPRLSMSTSQLLFRNSLMTGGKRDVAYVDLDQNIRRAQQDGERVELDDDTDEEPEGEEAHPKELHPPGKLLGRSLMDDLEARKTEIRGKRRVFAGDSRPSMMDRGLTRSSTLIDPSTLKAPQVQIMDGEGRPISQTPDVPRHQTDREKRRSGMPLVDLDGSPGRPTNRMTQSRSVFGVDTLWQRELTKLEQIEAAEKLALEEARRVEEARKGKRKGKKKAAPNLGPDRPTAAPEQPATDTPALPPTLPEVNLVSSRARPRQERLPNASDDDEGHGTTERRRVSTATLGVKGWFAGSSDDEDGGHALSRDHSSYGRPSPGATPHPPRIPGAGAALSPVDDESDEDLPLAAQIGRVRAAGPQLVLQPRQDDDDSEEDAPLAALIESKSKSRLSTAPSALLADDLLPLTPSPGAAAAPEKDSDDEDNVPLGLRASQSVLVTSRAAGQSTGNDEDEDEKPLGLRFGGAPPQMTPADLQQQQQQQYQLMLMQQQQQQQFIQAQMTQNSMSMMTPGGFGPMGMSPFGASMPMLASPMMPPQPHPDAAKIGRVDAWRKGVV